MQRTKALSIKKTKTTRDEFLADMVLNKDITELVATAVEMEVQDLPKIKVKYERANYLACIAILHWHAGLNESAREFVDKAKQELTKPNIVRDRLVFLLDYIVDQNAKGYRDCFTLSDSEVQ